MFTAMWVSTVTVTTVGWTLGVVLLPSSSPRLRRYHAGDAGGEDAPWNVNTG